MTAAAHRMTGAEHYREAERLLGEATPLMESIRDSGGAGATEAAIIGYRAVVDTAAVHATLAVAAASVRDVDCWDVTS